MALVYLDSSALAKLALHEPESHALRQALRAKREPVSSALARTEVLRAAMPFGVDACERAREVLDGVELVRVNDRVLDLAGRLSPAGLRSLDAIHLATAKLLADVKLVITYDECMAETARAMKWKVAAPR